MPSIRTSRHYTKLGDTQLSKFTGGTISGFTNNPDLATPPVLPKDLDLLKTAFDAAIIKANKGGSLATALKDAARAAVVAALDKNASYVDINCDDDMAILLSSTYEAVSTNRAQTVLAAPKIIAVQNGQTGEVKLRVKGDPNRKAIQGRFKTAAGSEFGPSISFRNSKAILFTGLTAGTTYLFQLCGLGGSTGHSDWSESVSKIAV